MAAVVLLAALAACSGADPGVTLCRYVNEFQIPGNELDGTQITSLVHKIDALIPKTRDPDVAKYAKAMVYAYYVNPYVRFPNASGEAAGACDRAYG